MMKLKVLHALFWVINTSSGSFSCSCISPSHPLPTNYAPALQNHVQKGTIFFMPPQQSLWHILVASKVAVVIFVNKFLY